MNKNLKITIKNACANNLKNINIDIEFGKLTVCVGPSGSGKSSFAFDTLINKKDCVIDNYPSLIFSVSQRIYNTNEKLNEIEKFTNINGALIVIDEPLAGTTNHEAIKYSKIIKSLSQNNAVIVVEHRREILEFADTVLVFGPESGLYGGMITEIMNGKDYTKKLPLIKINRVKNESNKKISALYNEFSDKIDYRVELVLNTITSITGECGSGKSAYLNGVFIAFDKAVGANEKRKNLIEVKNKNYIRRPYIIDASPVTKNSKSTVATYYGVSQFLKNKNQNFTIDEALNIYGDDYLITRRLQHLSNIGLGYLKLTQPSYTLSGGECQRIKLAKMLCKKLGDRCIYIFDNPVRGLGEENISRIMISFDKLVKNNNTILIAENDPTALLYVDNIIEMSK